MRTSPAIKAARASTRRPDSRGIGFPSVTQTGWKPIPRPHGERHRMDAPANTKQRALVVSSIFSECDAARQIGQQNYSYHFVYRAFAPLLERWGTTIPITQPESRLDYALWRARQN